MKRQHDMRKGTSDSLHFHQTIFDSHQRLVFHLYQVQISHTAQAVHDSTLQGWLRGFVLI